MKLIEENIAQILSKASKLCHKFDALLQSELFKNYFIFRGRFIKVLLYTDQNLPY